MPEGLSLTVVENTSTHLHIVLPPKPPEGEISEETLGGGVSGGWGGLFAWYFFRLGKLF